MNRQMSRWLQSTFPALPPGQVVNDVRVINDWLRRHGVPVEESGLGDILPGQPFTVIVEIP